ncbi:prorelaxin H1 [Boleophthalmus pectinirostris]|uniref:prorelaxin H1 n=1 Tax=Boleophthalmus pectinirostris TaxID=150288 RepID=UPI000A1C5073|nr:prorelaxin H1 [Boleophthalmus pectinirostris]
MMVKMAWRLTLAVAVVCVGSVCSSGQVDLMSRLLMQRDYGVKLCGREFIRAVIFTCGGSRWRRSTNDDLENQQWESDHDATEDDNQQSLSHVSEFTDTRAPLHSSQSLSLADLLAIYGALGERQPQHQQQFLKEPNPLEKPQASSFLGEQVVTSLTDNWPVSNKKKRNFSLGVAGMCCNQGCTKNDIGRLC